MKNAILSVVLAGLTLPAAGKAADQLKAAGGSCEITPPIGFPMWGYAARKDAPSLGVIDPLKARCLILAIGDTRLAIVSLDLGRPPTRDHMAAIRERVRAAGIHHVMLVGSHAHHGPILELDTWPDAQKPYTRELDEKLIDLIVMTSKKLEPARWGVGEKELPFNRNRQSKRPDAPADRTLTVLRVETLAGKPIAHLVNFAAHPVMIDAKDLRFSADFPGAMAAHVEQETGAPCLFLQGAAGDMSPRTPEGVRGHVEFGRALGREALSIVKSIRCADSAKPTLKVVEEDLSFKARVDVSNPLVKAALGQAFFPALIGFYEREYRDGVRPHLTVAVLDGTTGFVGVSGEFFSGHALSLRRRARLDHLLFCGYCNDYHQYFPTIEAASEGGYGTAPPMGLAELGAGERIIDRALLQLYQLRGLRN